MHFKYKFLVFISLNICITIILWFHDKFLDKVDEYLMTNSAQLCKEASPSLSKVFNSIDFLFIGSATFFFNFKS